MESQVLTGDCRDILKALPDKTFRCCVTSPPYWGLRDYDVDGQIGAETNPRDYITTLVSVFADIRRVLTNDGTLWLNIGDSYTSGGRTWRDADKKTQVERCLIDHQHQRD